MPILMSRDNSEGHKLEDLCQGLMDELEQKNQTLRMLFGTEQDIQKTDVALEVLRNNQAIQTQLKNIIYLQNDSMQRLETLGKEVGPEAPRL